jgi:hypothetical protein
MEFLKENFSPNNRGMLVGMDGVDSRGAWPKTPAGLRARAEHTRALARFIAHDEAAPTLRAYADELDARAEALESDAICDS